MSKSKTVGRLVIFRKKIIKYFLYIFFIPLWLVQIAIKRNKKVWIFGAWYGEKFSDNSKYFYKYVTENKKEINAIWLTRNENVFDEVKTYGGNVYRANSFQGIFYSLIASNIFISSGKEDVNPFCINGAVIFQLFHGSPLKKICLDDKFSTSNTYFHSKILPFLFPFVYEYNCKYVISNSSFFTPFLSSAFNVPIENIIETGCPRNDSFYIEEKVDFINELKSLYKDCKICVYLPTFRGNGEVQSIFSLFDYDKEKLETILEKNNLVFVSKGHYIDSVLELNDKKKSRIIHLKDTLVPDVNLLMKDADLLMTDYSSAYFDFLHTKKPIILAAFDLESYLTSSREMYFDYQEIICGPVVKNWKEIYYELENIWNEDVYSDMIDEKSKCFNKYLDNQNCKRLYDEVIFRS